MHFCRQLQDGNILQHGVADGSKVTLLPNVETGLVVSVEQITVFRDNVNNQKQYFPSLLNICTLFVVVCFNNNLNLTVQGALDLTID